MYHLRWPRKKARPTPQGRVSKSRSKVLGVAVNRRGKSLVFTNRKYKRKEAMNVGGRKHEGTSDIHGTSKTFLIAKSRGHGVTQPKSGATRP